MTAKNDKPLSPLTRLEEVIMSALWDKEQATAADITAAIQGQRPLAPTTVHTVLTNLKQKGWVRRVARTGRAYLFEAVVSRQKAGQQSLRELIASLFGGSVQSAVLCLLRDEGLTSTEREELRQLLSEHEKGEVDDERAN